MKKLLLMIPLVTAMTVSAEYQYIVNPGVRPEKPHAVVSTETIADAAIAGAVSVASATGGASWLYARWCEFTDYVRVRRDKASGLVIFLR